MWGPLFRALDASVCINIVAMEVIYLPAIFGRKKLDKEGFARNLILAIVTGWFFVLVFFGNLAFKYWLGLADPTESVADTPIRLIYCFGVLLGTTMHIATAKRSQYGDRVHSIAVRFSDRWPRPVWDWFIRCSGRRGWWCVLVLWLSGLVLINVALIVLDTQILPLVTEWPLVSLSQDSLSP